jgi:hypothetical protein
MSDYDYLPVSDGTGDAPLVHLTANRPNGSSVFTVDSVTRIPAKFIGTVGTILSTGFIDPATKQDFKGHVSGGTLVIDGWEPGSSDPVAGNTSGQVIVIKPNTGWSNRVAQFIKNATGLGTPEPHTISTLTATDVSTGTLETSGLTQLNGATKVGGTSYFQAQSTASVDGSGNITPASQVYRVTALAAAATIQVPSYAPQDGMTGELRIVDNGTSRALTWATGWKAIGVTLPTATNVGQFLYVSYEYSSSDSKWHVLSVARG